MEFFFLFLFGVRFWASLSFCFLWYTVGEVDNRLGGVYANWEMVFHLLLVVRRFLSKTCICVDVCLCFGKPMAQIVQHVVIIRCVHSKLLGCEWRGSFHASNIVVAHDLVQRTAPSDRCGEYILFYNHKIAAFQYGAEFVGKIRILLS
jgi:hypothetical protein